MATVSLSLAAPSVKVREREVESCENGEKARVLHGAEGGGGEGALAGEVEGEESGEECVSDVEPSPAEEEQRRSPQRGAAGGVDLEIREPEAGGGAFAAQGRARRDGRRRFQDGGKVGQLDEGAAL